MGEQCHKRSLFIDLDRIWLRTFELPLLDVNETSGVDFWLPDGIDTGVGGAEWDGFCCWPWLGVDGFISMLEEGILHTQTGGYALL